MRQPKDIQVSVIGGGLVGCLCSCILGNRGVRVKLYEARDDIDNLKQERGRSINLNLSERGRSSLRMAGLEEEVLRYGVPMRGRMVHCKKGSTSFHPYPKEGQSIYSVPRKILNEILVRAAKKNPNVEIFFKTKFLDLDLNTGKYQIQRPNGEVCEESSDLLIGSDGAYSPVRRKMLRMPRFNYSQTYMEHGYVEFCMPTTRNGEFAMEPNCMHIWPRSTFMLMAFPNHDKTFTVDFFLPYGLHKQLDTIEKFINFFQHQFPDAVPLIGKERLIKEFFGSPISSLISIKCSPYHIEDKVLILGDAAHAMVPFLGQGMNAGFEDCEILCELLDTYGYDFKKILPTFTERRHQDMAAICDLSMYNFIEMSHLITCKSFLLRKKFDALISSIFPHVWTPLISMVIFSKVRYSHCIEQKQKQDKILDVAFWTTAFFILSIITAFFFNKIFG